MSINFTQNADTGEWAFGPSFDEDLILGSVSDLGDGKWSASINPSKGDPQENKMVITFEAEGVEGMKEWINGRFVTGRVDEDGEVHTGDDQDEDEGDRDQNHKAFTAMTLVNMGMYSQRQKLDGAFIDGIVEGLSETFARRTCEHCRARFLAKFGEVLATATEDAAEDQKTRNMIGTVLGELLKKTVERGDDTETEPGQDGDKDGDTPGTCQHMQLH